MNKFNVWWDSLSEAARERFNKSDAMIAFNAGKSVSDENIVPWYRDVKAGQKLRPIPLWNEDASAPIRLEAPTVILDVKDATSQSGVEFKVKSKTGIEQWLDAAWFEQPTN